MEAASRFELEMKVLQTSALPLGYAALKKGTKKLRVSPDWRNPKDWSERRDLNSRQLPWQGRALPLSYSRLIERLI